MYDEVDEMGGNYHFRILYYICLKNYQSDVLKTIALTDSNHIYILSNKVFGKGSNF
jgi:hypothetical protein